MTLESPLDCKEIQPVLSKGDKSWVFFGSTDAKAETPILSPPHVDSLKRLWYWKGLRAGGEGDDRIWDGWMASPTQWAWVWIGDGQGGLACCSPWGHKELDMTEWLNWLTEWRNSLRKQTYGHREKGGEGEMYGESNAETHITICKIDSQWEFAVCLRNSNKASVST